MKWRNRVAILSRKPRYESNVIQQHQCNVEDSLGIGEKAKNLTSELTQEHTVIGPGNQRYYVFVRNSSNSFTCLLPGSSMPKPLFDVVDNMIKSTSEHQICSSNLRKNGSTVEQNVSDFHARKSIPCTNAAACESIEVSAVDCPGKDTMMDEATIHICDIQSDSSNNSHNKCHTLYSQHCEESKGAWVEMPNGTKLQARGNIDEAFQRTYSNVKKGELQHVIYSEEGCRQLPHKLGADLPCGKTKVWSCETVGPLEGKEIKTQASLTSHLENSNKMVDSDVRKCSGEDILEQSYEMLYMLFQDENQNCVFGRADKTCEEKAESLQHGGDMRTRESVGVYSETEYIQDICQLLQMNSSHTIDGLGQNKEEIEGPQHIWNKETTKQMVEDTACMLQDCSYDFSESPQLLNEISLPPNFSLQHGYEID